MKILLTDQNTNQYLSAMYWGPLRSYAHDQGRQIEVGNVDEAKDSIVLVHGDTMSPERIERIKENGNVLVIWDINDSSYLSSAYIHSPQQELVDLIFKVSGVPKENEVNEMNLDRNFRIQISREKYLPDEQWWQFQQIRHKIRPLPYVLWNPIIAPNETPPSAEARNGKVLVRGGNHFWRVVLAFRLMQDGLLDERSEFHTGAYFSEGMEKRFQYCDECKAEKLTHGRSLYDAPVRRSQCTSPVTGWEIPGEFYGGPMFGRHEHGWWNNKCPHSFFFLAKEFERLRGPLDHGFIERMFNGDMRGALDFKNDLMSSSYAGDSKWLNTINIPPRFWEAASVGTVNFYPDRTADQDYWPNMNAGQHYLTFAEHMDNFDLRDISPAVWTAVSREAKALYEEQIRGTRYPISTALLGHIWEEITNLA